MKDNLSHEPWLNLRQTQQLLSALSADGAQVCFVGGIVRDSLLERTEAIGEIDLAIDRNPEEIIGLLEKAEIKPIPIGASHGTIACELGEQGLDGQGLDRQRYEITSLRVDVASDGRHAEVAFTQDWLGDAQRRDFTINAIYADSSGILHDPLNGREDLAKGCVRFIGDAKQRIEEDYLRILRFFRFFSWFGQGEADREALAACAQAKEGLKRLSAERIAAELFKLLIGPRAPEALRLMAALEILPLLLPSAGRLDFYSRMHALMYENFIEPNGLRLFASLYGDRVYGDRESVLSDGLRLKLSKADCLRLERLFAEDEIKLKSYLSIREVRKLLYRLGVETFSDKVWLAWSRDRNPRNGIGWRALLALAESWERPKFLLTGKMVRAAGVSEGEAIGRIMSEVEEWWIEADFIDDEFSIIERLKAIIQATIYNER